MKIVVSKRQKQSASVLLITMMLATILGATLAGYLYWVRTQNLLVVESQAWNTALACAEAGIEEGMAQINANFGTNYVPSISTNWPSSIAGVYGPRTGTFTNGSYSVIVVPTVPCPTIIATGYTIVPLVGRQIARTVQVTTTNQSAFTMAMAAEQDITLKGNDVGIDSYDSSDPLHSTNGMYYPPTRKAGGDVASLLGLVSVNNANINGKLYTGATASYSVGANGYVGDLSWTSGIEPGWWSSDFNMDFKDVQLPDTSTWIPATAGVTNTYLLGSGGYYINGDLSLKSGDSMYVVGFASLYVSGNVNMQGQGTIIIAPGAQLKIYVAGPTANFSYVNTTGNAFSFQYYGLPTNTSLTWGGNSSYVGTVYAPEALFTCGGGGSLIYDYQGSCVVNTVAFNGHFNFHYDENLKRNGPALAFVVTSWQEL
jgi:hypothetical protein